MIGQWVSEDLLITAEEKAILETDNVFVRRYKKARGEEVFLFIVYAQNNRKVSHPPEICYTGGGAAILDSVHDEFRAEFQDTEIKVNRLTVEKGRVKQIFAYWFKVGGSYTSNYWQQQGLIALNSLLGKPASSALIRISATVGDDGESDVTRRIKEFGRLIVPHLQKHLP